MKIIFWASFLVLFYTYIGYPVFLILCGLAIRKERDKDSQFEPDISMIIPVYNEETIIKSKVENTLSLDYPKKKLEVLFVSDASTDGTNDIINQFKDTGVSLFVLTERTGKAGALNRGLKEAKHEIIVFSDASIMLAPDALNKIVRRFKNDEIGCISGEDHITGGGGEGSYGKYELFLRNIESRIGSIVGASGCFYAQRRILCSSFKEGMAPDFISVLETAEQGFRSITEPEAKGTMQKVKRSKQEFDRKVRTLLRGITTLLHFKHLMNPLRYGLFSFELISHKILRWSSGFFLFLLFFSNLFLITYDIYLLFFILQATFYSLSVIGWIGIKGLSNKLLIKIPYFFFIVNASTLIAWIKYFKGLRQEIWEPSKR
ncbi:MAG: glycosyltransferase family 2 protein [Deltaproteobacteria bacterium]|nr:glycosyltransferase family 2 protein [Deltaproteobacteria bacterium]